MNYYLLITILVCCIFISLFLEKRRRWLYSSVGCIILLYAAFFSFDIPGFLEMRERAKIARLKAAMSRVAKEIRLDQFVFGQANYLIIPKHTKGLDENMELILVKHGITYLLVNKRSASLQEFENSFKNLTDGYDHLIYDPTNGSFSEGYLITKVPGIRK